MVWCGLVGHGRAGVVRLCETRLVKVTEAGRAIVRLGAVLCGKVGPGLILEDHGPLTHTCQQVIHKLWNLDLINLMVWHS